MQIPAVIASDLDGTLLGENAELSQRTRKALIAAREHGLAVVAVTARSPHGVENIPDLMPLLDTAICANGALMYDPVAERTRVLRAIDVDTARAVARTLLAALPNGALAIETGEKTVGFRRHFTDLVDLSWRWEFVETVEELLERAETIIKLKIFDPDMHAEEMVAAVEGSDLAELDMCHWGDFGMLDFNARGANKATGLSTWCAERGLGPESVVAFGDMPNDVPMLAWAGRSYSVEGAHPEAVAAAGGRTAANTEDGVAQVIEEVIAQLRNRE